jgi:hypothetical protein
MLLCSWSMAHSAWSADTKGGTWPQSGVAPLALDLGSVRCLLKACGLACLRRECGGVMSFGLHHLVELIVTA